MFSRKRLIVIITVLIVVISFSILVLKRAKPIEVILTTVETGPVERTVTNTRAGTLKACRRARLSPSIGGQISNLPVRDGDTVKTGQILFEIWNEDLQAQMQLAKSELQASRARAKEACVLADVAKTEAKRLTQLRKKALTSDEKVDQAVGLAESKRAGCNAATSMIKVSQSRVAVAQAALDRTQLTAPFAGAIAEVNGELGEYVTPSPVGVQTQPAIDLIDNSCLYVAAPIDEVDAPEIKAGMTARITLDAFGKEYFNGKVRRVAPYVLDIEKQARTVDIEVDFLSEKDNANMLPGYTADVEVIIDARSRVLRIPSEAILEGNRVYLYDTGDESITELEIVSGLSNWRFTEIKSGLEEGQQIVLSIDRDGLSDGARVKIEKAK
ncbi:Macrolide-specific efflux protein MacA [hydrothermal vent metagenome]|uniref:Macrolide-specific efflux protein MacA n=1 Tax=hydrothermal vent metagenome TaxID=652676 RepID=A0A3B1APR8_9ZZZZ